MSGTRDAARASRPFGPIFVLALSSAILSEVGSGSIPPSRFIDPAIWLPLLTIGYGIPMLILRELSVSRGLAAIIILGLAYSIVNEGFLAKTLLLVTNVPLPVYDGYGIVGGINTTWLSLVGPWHVINSVLGSLAVVYALFPEWRARRWLSDRWVVILAALQSAGCTAVFFTSQPGRDAGDASHFTVFAMLVAGLVWLACIAPASTSLSEGRARSLRPFWFGVALFGGLTLAPFLLAAVKVPLIVYFAWTGLAAIMALWTALRCEVLSIHSVLLGATGNVAAQSVWVLLGSLSRADTERSITALVLLAIAVLVASRIAPTRENL